MAREVGQFLVLEWLEEGAVERGSRERLDELPSVSELSLAIYCPLQIIPSRRGHRFGALSPSPLTQFV